MPGKHVRFDLQRSYTLPSSTSSSSQQAPIRRKSQYHSHHYYSTPSTTIHPVLAYAAFKYDLRNSPSTIVVSDPRQFSQAACNPPAPYMSFIVPYLPWSVIVSPTSNGSYVTVSDVFSALYASLRKPVSGSEYNSILSGHDRRAIARTYEERYHSVYGSRDQQREKLGGVRRVDYLGKKTRFAGVTPSKTGRDVWEVVVR